VGIRGCSRGIWCQKRLRLSWKVDECKPCRRTAGTAPRGCTAAPSPRARYIMLTISSHKLKPFVYGLKTDIVLAWIGATSSDTAIRCTRPRLLRRMTSDEGATLPSCIEPYHHLQRPGPANRVLQSFPVQLGLRHFRRLEGHLTWVVSATNWPHT
jgi:hypothetical protein